MMKKMNQKQRLNLEDLNFKEINASTAYTDIQLNYYHDMEIEYHPYHDNWGYWVVKNIFKYPEKYANFFSNFPVFLNNETSKYNGFYKQIYPELLMNPLYEFVRYFNKCVLDHTRRIKILECISYSNIYFPNDRKPKFTLFNTTPHTDVVDIFNNNIVANFWISNGDNGGTSFWEFEGNPIYSEDFSKYRNSIIDEESKDNYINYNNDSKFKKVAQSNNKFNSVVIYNGIQIHSPFVSNSLRWSQVVMANQQRKSNGRIPFIRI